MKQQIKENKTEIDISKLTNGVYFVKLVKEMKSEVKKIIIE
jgi:hypothetical protein